MTKKLLVLDGLKWNVAADVAPVLSLTCATSSGTAPAPCSSATMPARAPPTSTPARRCAAPRSCTPPGATPTSTPAPWPPACVSSSSTIVLPPAHSIASVLELRACGDALALHLPVDAADRGDARETASAPSARRARRAGPRDPRRTDPPRAQRRACRMPDTALGDALGQFLTAGRVVKSEPATSPPTGSGPPCPESPSLPSQRRAACGAGAASGGPHKSSKAAVNGGLADCEPAELRIPTRATSSASTRAARDRCRGAEAWPVQALGRLRLRLRRPRLSSLMPGPSMALLSSVIEKRAGSLRVPDTLKAVRALRTTGQMSRDPAVRR